LSAGRVSAPSRIAATTQEGLLAAMPAHLSGAGFVTKLVSVFPRNHELGLPSHQALVLLFEERGGSPVACLEGAYLTAARTAGGSAVATRMLARADARVLTILGAGVEGSHHLGAVARTRDFGEIRIASRNRDHADILSRSHPGAQSVVSFEDAVRGADVVCCCTDSPEPVLRRDWLKPGAHVNSVGFARGGPELDTETIRHARLFVESDAAFAPYPAGCHELQGVSPEKAAQLGEVLSGDRPGRTADTEITLYKSVGHAAEDAAAAWLVYRRALESQTGQEVSLL
jgi:ornithine cyclodeaminase/alanine dehydrogenase-like protein (mu-crystallin family)